MIAKSRRNLYFADPLGQSSFVRQQYKQMMPQPLRFSPNVCSFYPIYAAFHLFKFQQEENTGFRDVKLLSFMSKYMYFFIIFNLNVQVIQCFCF